MQMSTQYSLGAAALMAWRLLRDAAGGGAHHYFRRHPGGCVPTLRLPVLKRPTSARERALGAASLSTLTVRSLLSGVGPHRSAIIDVDTLHFELCLVKILQHLIADLAAAGLPARGHSAAVHSWSLRRTALVQLTADSGMAAANSALRAFLEEYISQLSDLKSAIKAKINSLTMLAAETAADSPAAAPSIVAAVEKRIVSVSGRCFSIGCMAPFLDCNPRF